MEGGTTEFQTNCVFFFWAFDAREVLCSDKAELFFIYIFFPYIFFIYFSGSRKKKKRKIRMVSSAWNLDVCTTEENRTGLGACCTMHRTDTEQKTVLDQAATHGNLAVDAVLHISCCRNISLLRTAGYGFTASIPFLFLELSNLRKGHQDVLRSTNFGRRLSKLFFTTSRTCHPNIQCCCCHSYSPFHELVGFLYANGLWIMLNGAHKQYTRGVRDVCVYYLVLSEDY